MATLNITEYSDIAQDYGSRGVLVGREPSLATQSITFTTSTQSADLHAKTRFVRVISDADAHLHFNSNPVSTVVHTRIEANVAEYFGIEIVRNQNLKISAYDGTS